MSKHNTMTSNVSGMLSQKQNNLQQLQNLQNHTKSLTSNEVPPSTNGFAPGSISGSSQPQFQQPAPYPLEGLTSETTAQNTLTGQQIRSDSGSTYRRVQSVQLQSPQQINGSPGLQQGFQQVIPQGSSQGHPQMQSQVQSQGFPSQMQSSAPVGYSTMTTNTSGRPLQGRNSLTSTSNISRARTSAHRQRNSLINQHDPRSPLVVLMPTSAQPTEILANRFSAWRNIIKSIIIYLTETASIQDEIVRQQLRLTHAIQFPFFVIENQHQPTTSEEKASQKFFLPLGNGSIQDLPTILNQYHGSLASHASRASKELTNDVIPRLEDLRRDLLVKMKEIKSLQSDFKNNCGRELQQTKQDMKHFLESIEEATFGTAKQDPYLTKIILDKQIRKQLTEENFVHEAFDNLENSGAELERVVVMEIQNALTLYARLLGEESQLVFDILISKLDNGFFNKDPQFEWENFILRDPNFIVPNLPMRKMKEIVYKHQYNPLIHEIKSGVLERRSKFLKSYSKGFYVLTPSFLHEFKTADRKKDMIPVMSLSLSECTVTEHSKKGSADDRFVVHAKQNGIIHRGHNWVFRADNYETMMSWFEDLKILTSTSNIQEKTKFVTEKLNLQPDGRPKPKSSSAQTSVTNTPTRPHVEIASANNFPTSTPRLDDQTNTNTTSSIPDTNDIQLDAIPNIYVDAPERPTKEVR
ncbi:hypothetical protein HG535_0D02230 [Zygotorulaspora mrakii]|uniref:PH domain-containing protein n=1 Tax=Zygotorulaspora mrakii TaxID=42260 RepID=A0A7H9B1H5_ZYGMR|nr:uncharacterized protein HG535_0D02230 [Zygotorulaspora mrakii]QLG72515.1 hypothetical protein HG535_0D02230 [Zygotorulaspora mrakii]